MDPNSPNNGGSKSSTGLEPNLAGALSYVLSVVTGVIFLLIEKDQFVRFHAYQSIFLWVAWIVFWVVFQILIAIFGFLGFLAAIIGFLSFLVLQLGMFVLWIVLIVKAYQGQRWKLPYIGDMAEKYAGH